MCSVFASSVLLLQVARESPKTVFYKGRIYDPFAT